MIVCSRISCTAFYRLDEKMISALGARRNKLIWARRTADRRQARSPLWLLQVEAHTSCASPFFPKVFKPRPLPFQGLLCVAVHQPTFSQGRALSPRAIPRPHNLSNPSDVPILCFWKSCSPISTTRRKQNFLSCCHCLKAILSM